MTQAEQASKRKRRNKTFPVWGAAGLSVALASGASAVPGGLAADMPTRNMGDGHEIFFGEEEISDVTLATFYVFDKENIGEPGSSVQLAAAAIVATAAAAATAAGDATCAAAEAAAGEVASELGSAAAAAAAAIGAGGTAYGSGAITRPNGGLNWVMSYF